MSVSQLTPGESLLVMRRRLGLQRRPFAKLAGFSYHTLRAWEDGVYTPSPENAQRIRQAWAALAPGGTQRGGSAT